MNDAAIPQADLITLAAICVEATRSHGDNWAAIERHIRNGVSALPKDQRKRLEMEIDRVLRYCPPTGNATTQ